MLRSGQMPALVGRLGLVLCALSLAACRSSGTGDLSATATAMAPASASSSGSATPNEAATSTPVSSQPPATYRIGVLLSLTGPNSTAGIQIRNAIELEVKRVNASGGVKGQLVELDVRDDAATASQGVVGVKQLTQDRVSAMLGPQVGAVAAAVAPVVQEARVPTIMLTSDAGVVQPVRSFVFTDAPLAPVQAQALLSYLQQRGVHKVAALRDVGAPALQGVEAMQQSASQYQVKLIQDETYEVSDTDISRQAVNIANNPAVEAAVVWSSSGIGAESALKSLQAQHVAFPIVLISPAPSLAVAQGAPAGTITEATRLTLARDLLPDDPSRAAIIDFTQRYRTTWAKAPDEFAGRGYDAFYLMVEALRAGGNDPAKIAAAIESSVYDGVEGPYHFSSQDHGGVQASALAMAEIQGQQLLPVLPNCHGCFTTSATLPPTPAPTTLAPTAAP